MSANLDIFTNIERFAVCQSSIHEIWARQHSSRLGMALKYSPGNAYETFVFPTLDAHLRRLGDDLLRSRRELMTTEHIGLTKLYNRVHAPDDSDSRVRALRDLQREMDLAVVHAYGWDDLDLEHGFHIVPYLPRNDCERFTISGPARLEVLQRLGDLNRQRYEEEQALAPTTKPRASKRRAKAKAVPNEQGSLALADRGPAKAIAPAKKIPKKSER